MNDELSLRLMGIDDLPAELTPTNDEENDERKLFPHPGILRRQLPIIWLLRRSDRCPSLELMLTGVAPSSNGSSLGML